MDPHTQASGRVGPRRLAASDRDILEAIAEGRLTPLDALERLAPHRPPEEGGGGGTSPDAPGRKPSERAAAAPTGVVPPPVRGPDRSGATSDRPPASGRTLTSPPPPAHVALASLEPLVGLTEVKRVANEVYAMHAVARMRRSLSLTADEMALHMIFTGRPGTGKTTVARAFAHAFETMGVLTRGHLVEVDRSDLVGEYVGHTAQRTREVVARARGGVLFVDEAYSLSRGGEKDFGREALDTLVRLMEEHRGDLVVILAGYPREMEALLALNPGLRSRIPIRVDFPDYTPGELTEIALRLYSERGYVLAPGALQRLPHFIARLVLREEEHLGPSTPSAGNARTVRNLVEASLRRAAVRMLRVIESSPERSLDRTFLSTVEVEDLTSERSEQPAGAHAQLNAVVRTQGDAIPGSHTLAPAWGGAIEGTVKP